MNNLSTLSTLAAGLAIWVVTTHLAETDDHEEFDAPLPPRANNSSDMDATETTAELMVNRFRALVAEWKRERHPGADIADTCSHPAYRRIVDMGPVVVPMILVELTREPDMWFAALETLTNAKPVPAADRGKFRLVTQAWLQWGRQHGHLPRVGLQAIS